MAPYVFLIMPILAISIGLVAVIGSHFVKPWFAHRERKLEIEGKTIAERAAQYAASTGRIEERVRVL